MSATVPRVAVGPTPWPLVTDAVVAAGGRVVDLDEADALVWVDWTATGDLRQVLAGHPGLRWVHLPGAGVERFLESVPELGGRTWTCSKGAHSSLIAEHALALALAGLHGLPAAARATSWHPASVGALMRRPVTIIGGGGIAASLTALLRPFGCPVTAVRRRASVPVPGALRTVGRDGLLDALAGARLVVVALALTPETHRIVGATELAAMDRRAWLVNVSRGGHVDTDALVSALATGTIAGAALDVTDPEPLPDEHPLWALPNCIVTPHSAGNSAAVMRLLAERVGENVRRFASGEALLGVVDAEAGY